MDAHSLAEDGSAPPAPHEAVRGWLRPGLDGYPSLATTVPRLNLNHLDPFQNLSKAPIAKTSMPASTMATGMQIATMFRAVADQCAVGIMLQCNELLIYANQAALDCLGMSSIEDIPGGALERLFERESYETLCPNLRKVVPDDDQMFIGDLKMRRRGGDLVEAEVYHIGFAHDMAGASMINFRDVTMLRKMEVDLRQAQKLESVGRLAAGVAHEINTPVQFVNDSLHFVREANADLAGLISKYQILHKAVTAGEPCDEAAADIAETEATIDLGYLMENVPAALDRAVDGLNRVTTIVRSLKEFAHPDEKEMVSIDLNQAISSTLTIARNEYKYLATLETDLGEVPPVRCHGGDINQVILNLIVNAAHAIGDVVQGTDTLGLIRVRSWLERDRAIISISDTGGGIPLEIRTRIYDPFFTTKAVGKGTGQGLAIARSVVEKHGGELTFESELGAGTTFFIRLPLDGGDASTRG
jgi:signal transduction histidine kinase